MGAVKLEDVYYTYEDYRQWKGDWELIDGVPFAMAPVLLYLALDELVGFI